MNASPFEIALKIALSAHEGRQTTDGRPYILHPLHLALEFDDELLQVVALLHDVLEDSEDHFREAYETQIEHEFGPSVLSAVEHLTKHEDETYMEYVKRCKKNVTARLVKIADLKHNMDLTRIPRIDDDWILKRTRRYHRALRLLEDA